MFDRGEFSLVILALVGEKPRYGYEIIKKLGERVGGDYSPSPGIVYPTLIAMEGLGYASVTQDQARRKLYTVTPEGKKALAENKAGVDAIFYRFGEPDVARGAGSVVRATMNLSATVQMRLDDQPVDDRENLGSRVDAGEFVSHLGRAHVVALRVDEPQLL